MKKQDKASMKWAIVILGVIALGIILSIVVALVKNDKETKQITDFDSCVAAGNPVMESYPEQCSANGATYINESQVAPVSPEQMGDGSAYIGLSEQAALDKTNEATIPARVVERDGEGLPVTMDFVLGRHNLYVKDGIVYKVDIEGQATDVPETMVPQEGGDQ